MSDGADHGRAVVDIAGQALLHLVERLDGDADLRRPSQVQGLSAWIAAQALGRRGEGGDGRGQAAREQIGQGDQGDEAEAQPEQQPLLPGRRPQGVLRLDDQPAAARLLHRHHEGSDQKVVVGQPPVVRHLAADQADRPAVRIAGKVDIDGDDARIDTDQVAEFAPMQRHFVPVEVGPLGRRVGLAQRQRRAIRRLGCVAGLDQLGDLADAVEVRQRRRQVEDHQDVDGDRRHQAQHAQRQGLHEQAHRSPFAALPAAFWVHVRVTRGVKT